jgi:phosphatidate cytidylyltransferase
LNNTSVRIIVSVFAIPLILAACYFGRIYFFFFTLAVALISFYEFYLLAKKKGANVSFYVGVFAILFLMFNGYLHLFDSYSFLLIVVVATSLIELFRNNGSAIINISTTLLGIFYIGLFSVALLDIREFYPSIDDLYLRGGFLIISILVSIWICDSAAYFAGLSLGKHKLFPRVSPKKSWEGAIFGFVFAILTMIIAHFLVLHFLPFTHAIILGIIIGIVGQIGDLIESLLKRDAQVKDSSSLIPGHGGVFDRFDSLLFSAPVILLYLRYFT